MLIGIAQNRHTLSELEGGAKNGWNVLIFWGEGCILVRNRVRVRSKGTRLREALAL